MVTVFSGWVASSLARRVCSGNRGRGQSLRAACQGPSPMGAGGKGGSCVWGLEGAAFPPALFLCSWML